MEFTIACPCGKVIPATDGMAGASLSCDCGATVVVPPLSVLRAHAISDATPPYVPDSSPLEEKKPEPRILSEIISPMWVSVRSELGAKSNRRPGLMAALTSDALWIQDTWRLRYLPLHEFAIESPASGKELRLTLLRSEPPDEKLTLKFASSDEAKRWHQKIQDLQSKTDPFVPPVRRTVPEGVALVRKAPEVERVEVGHVSCVHKSPHTADRGAQLRAAMRGADAIIELRRKKCPEMGPAARQVSGTAIRALDADARKRLRWTWYSQELTALLKGMLLLVLIEASVIFCAIAFLQGKLTSIAATGMSRSESIASTGLGVGLIFGWPLLLVALLWVVRWRELLSAVGIAVLTVTTARGLTLVLAHLLAVWTTGTAWDQSKMWMLADPVDWAFMIFGLVLGIRAWQLSARARQILPEEAQIASAPRRLWSRGLLATTGVLALCCLGFIGFSRYEQSSHLLQPGVDTRREQEAMLAMNEGADSADSGDLGAAEASFQKSLRLWEALTAGRAAPSTYRINLAVTLYDLGWIRRRQSRDDEAEPYFARAVALADQIGDDPQLDEPTRQTLAGARKALTQLRHAKNFKLLDRKSAEADRKCEEADVKRQNGERDAEDLYREAIALWEEVLPQATNPGYRKSTVSQLAWAHLRLGELERQTGNRSGSEASLKKAIDYGEKAAALDPSRLLLKHNLGVARRTLERLHEQAFQDEVDKLARAQRLVEAADLFKRAIQEQDARVRSGKETELAVPSLAYRLDRFAWFLAHCPDKSVRDTKASVENARRAVEMRSDVGDYWYTLAMVQYRNGDWLDSLASLEKVKVIKGEFDACDWLISAMDLYRLGREHDARAALRKAGDWIDERTRNANDDPRLRIEYELMRPAVDGLLWEARQLFGENVNVG